MLGLVRITINAMVLIGGILQAPADAKNMIAIASERALCAIALAISIARVAVSCYAILSKAYRDD